ncbi:MAG TPA: hypothetical protein VHS96_14905, partial [Bacteroidia bacterium]|nr:hypothetical protein [Bacteroidia bacterium]
MKDIIRFYRLGCATLGIAILCLSGCKEDRFRIRVAPGSDVCMESLLSINSGTLQGSAASESGLGLPELKALALDKDNLKRAIGGRAYILHFYRRLEDKDEEISPVKFPFYWEIDSTKLQTEGTYLVDIQSASELKIAFRCEDCQLIDASGQSSPGKKAGFESEFDSPTQARHCNEDACFALRPRKLDLSPEVGKQYLVRIESQQTYLT